MKALLVSTTGAYACYVQCFDSKLSFDGSVCEQGEIRFGIKFGVGHENL